MTRDEAFYAFGKAIGDQKYGLHFPNLLRFGSLPKADAPLHEHLEFVGRVAEAIGSQRFYISHGMEYAPGKRSTTILFHETGGSGCAEDASWSALLAALAALETR